MALVWLRASATYELLGFFFNLSKRNAPIDARDTLAAARQAAEHLRRVSDGPSSGARNVPVDLRYYPSEILDSPRPEGVYA